MRRGAAGLLALALLAGAAAAVVAQARSFPGPPTDTNPRANTPNDPDYDLAEPDDEDGDFVPGTSVFQEEHRLFGFAPASTSLTAVYGAFLQTILPAGSFIANASRTRLRYRALAPGLTRVTLSVDRRSGGMRVRLRGRRLDLAGADRTEITTTLGFGADAFRSTNTFRALRTKLRFP